MEIVYINLNYKYLNLTSWFNGKNLPMVVSRCTNLFPINRFLILMVFVIVSFSNLIYASELEPDRNHLLKIKNKDEITISIDKALAWIVTKQDVTYGFFNGKYKNTETALACIALMAAGHFPNRSKYGEHLKKGILYLVKASQNRKQYGYLGLDGGRVYGHGICTLALAEAYGMLDSVEDNKKVKEALEAALQITLQAQVKIRNKHFGGWRYTTKSKDADLSVTVWQVLSLRSAKNCGIKVPQQAIDNAVNYIRQCYNQKQKGFAYMPKNGSSSAMKCAGIVSLLAMGSEKNKADMEKILNSAKMFKTLNPAKGSHFYYNSYYYATAANMLGPEYRNLFLPKLEKVLLKLQKSNGEFKKHSGHIGGVYATSFAIICLAVKYQFLPIYQE